MTRKCIVWVKTRCSTRCTPKIGHLNADVVCIFVFFQILMWATLSWWWWWWQDALSPVLSLTDVCGSWQTPLSLSHHLSPHRTSLWARDSAQSSRARVTSRYSHHIVRFTTHPARKSDNLNRSPRTEKALPHSTTISHLAFEMKKKIIFQILGTLNRACCAWNW